MPEYMFDIRPSSRSIRTFVPHLRVSANRLRLLSNHADDENVDKSTNVRRNVRAKGSVDWTKLLRIQVGLLFWIVGFIYNFSISEEATELCCAYPQGSF